MKFARLNSPARSRLALAAYSLIAIGLVPALNAADAPAKVSYHKQIRPIFQTHCQGCHQPAKPLGNYVMTAFDRMIAAGESGEKAIVPGDASASYLLKQIALSADGKAAMPKGKPALNPLEIELVKQWITEGAANDTPLTAANPYDQDHPPQYSRQPGLTSLNFNADGSLLAVSGFSEVLLLKSDTGELAGRLVGMSERIEAVEFSPDGTRLAVAAGNPGRMGEVQVWDVAARKLVLSAPYTYDTIYGISWSPDGTKLAFGCSDNSVRAISVETGEQLVFMGGHNDWALDTVWSKDGSHLVSVGRDRTVKLTEVATQRFVDNITSITPGALKGGVNAVARHPERDELVLGGVDGIPKVYRIFRLVNRVIGDDSNIIRNLPAMTGRINAVAVSKNGQRIAAVSSLDGAGELSTYNYDFDTALPDNIKGIMAKVSTSRSKDEADLLDAYINKDVRRVAQWKSPVGLFAVAFRPDGQQVAVAGYDGLIRLLDTESGALVKEFPAAPLSPGANPPAAALSFASTGPAPAANAVPANLAIAKLDVQPQNIQLTGPFDYAQLLVTGVCESGERIDLTAAAKFTFAADQLSVSPAGLIRPLQDCAGQIAVKYGSLSVDVPFQAGGLKEPALVDFVRDVNPVLSRLGCNQGTCHGSAQGKNGFKLSLRGYDPLFDVRSFTDDLAGRRVNLASADDSLMLLKPTGAVPHTGGAVMSLTSPEYRIVRDWIAAGCRLNAATPRVAKIEILPKDPIVERIGSKQQFRIVATYVDGKVRDVTQEAFVESGNGDVATAAPRGGLMTAVRRGEAPVLARFEGAYTATILTVMGDRSNFQWQDAPSHGPIDDLVAAKWKRMKIRPSELCNDAEFLRRASLDLTGLPPTAEAVRAFLADPRDSRVKREELVDKLVGSEDYVEHWANKWADLLQVNGKFLGRPGAQGFRDWIRKEVAANTPYDEFARRILTATGSNRENPAASYYKILREPTATMENTTHLFLAVRFNCNKCHDHPFERWTQDQYYETAAYFAQVGLSRDNVDNNPNIGGTAVEGAKPMWEVVADLGSGDVKHDRTGALAMPKFPYDVDLPADAAANRRQQLARWITASNNPYFARSYVNRLWGYLLGVGLMEPLDDIRAGNPPSNPELLDHLTQEFIRSGFNVQHMVKLIAKSRTYQLSVAVNEWNSDDKTNYSHALARRLPAEVLYDAVYRVTGTPMRIPGVAQGTRAAALPDSEIDVNGFLATAGRPVRESACECERTTGMQLGPVMSLVSGPVVADAIGEGSNELTKLARAETDLAKLVNEVFLRILNRPATSQEIAAVLDSDRAIDADHRGLLQRMAEREIGFAPTRRQRVQERDQAVSAARKTLDDYTVNDLIPNRTKAEIARLQRVANAEQDAKAYEAGPYAAAFNDWLGKQTAGGANPGWTPLLPKSQTATGGISLAHEADGVIFASGPFEQTVYTIEYEIDAPRAVSALRLEAISDPRLGGGGPGRSPNNGNFVLSEMTVKVRPKGTPKRDGNAIAFVNPLADFSQENYPVAGAVDGKSPNRNGWAISPQTGKTHWATFELKEAAQWEAGVIVTVTMSQQYGDKQHSLGKFRLSTTSAAAPIGLSLPGRLPELLATPADQRTPEHVASLQSEYRQLDAALQKKWNVHYNEQQPLPPDAKLKELQDALAVASRPIAEDVKLLDLRRDSEQSTGQLAERRLTLVQDLAWALINSPAFLFNH